MRAGHRGRAFPWCAPQFGRPSNWFPAWPVDWDHAGRATKNSIATGRTPARIINRERNRIIQNLKNAVAGECYLSLYHFLPSWMLECWETFPEPERQKDVTFAAPSILIVSLSSLSF